MKSVCLLSRRTDLAREAFRDYYETAHAIVGMTHFPFAKYVRNHVVASSPAVDFDCLSEFWQDDLAEAARVLQSPVGEAIRADEARFMDQSAIRPAASREELLAGAPREVDGQVVSRRILLLARPPSTAREPFLEAARALGRELAGAAGRGVRRATLDVITPYGPAGAIPFDALLSFWLEDPAAAREEVRTPASLRLVADVLAELCESTPAELAARYRKPAAVQETDA